MINNKSDLMVSGDKAKQLKKQSKDWKSWDLTPRQICDVEMLINGAFAPLKGFLNQG